MRTLILLSLTAMVAVAAGCGSQGREQTGRSALQRDLTLAPQAHAMEIASTVELQQLRAQHRTVRPSRQTARSASARSSSRTEPKIILASVAAPAPALAAAAPVAQPASTAADSPNDRELLPGKTVTVIPASSGPSTGAEGNDEFPTARVGGGGSGMGGGGSGMGGGGRCPGRGPDIGIAGVPRPDFR